MDKQMQGLLAQANPQLARLLDEQERQKAQQARMQGANYGNDAMGRFLSAYSGAARSATEGGQALANNVMGNKPAMGRREQMAVQAQQAQQGSINQAKEMALLAVQSNTSLDEQTRRKAQELIQSSSSPAQLQAIATRFGTPTKQGNAAVEKLNDGSVIRINNNVVTEVSPPSLSGFMGMSQSAFEGSNTSESIPLAQQAYQQGIKNRKSDEEIRRDVTNILQPNLDDIVKNNYIELTQTAKGYGLFDETLPRTIEALDNANVGSLGGVKQFFGKTLEALGVDINSVEDTELVNRILTKEVLNNAQFMKGTLSDKDIEFLKQTIGTQSTSLEGLKEAFVELAVRKEAAYKASLEFSKLNNVAKNSFDFEKSQARYYKESRSKYADMFGLEKKQSGKAPPAYLSGEVRPSSAPSEQDMVDFFNLPKGG